MTENSNDTKRKQLGMPYGTASGRLKKNIMLSLAQRLNEDICFKCGEKILTAEELSIDHKKPWLHVSNDLFWDLENIAFSHLKCNKTDRPNMNRQIKAPPGEAWCGTCKRFKEISLFYADKSRANGLKKICKICEETVRKNRKSVSHK